MKQYGHQDITLEQAQKIAKQQDDEINAIKEHYIATHEQVINESIGKMIDDVVVNVIRESLKKEIGGLI